MSDLIPDEEREALARAMYASSIQNAGVSSYARTFDALPSYSQNLWLADAGAILQTLSRTSQPVQVEVTDRPELPEGAEYFPDEGGIQYQGRVYYPADYVLTRSDIAALRVKTLTDAADEVEAIIALGEQAETVAFPPGTTGLSEAIERRDSLYEEPAAWLRARAAALGVPVSPESEGKK